jgi:3-oxoacyl-[acyl-carrier protein] reductase
MMGLIENKVAIITGSGRGIGKAIAMAFVREGASVVINDLDPEPAQDTVNEINGMGGKAVACPGNVVDRAFPEKILKTGMDQFGKIDIIVNNAGYTWDSVIQNMTDEQWYAMIDVHASAPFRLLRAAAPILRDAAKKDAAEGKRVHRKVVNISSLAGVCGNAGQVNYCAAKAAIQGITMSLAKEWGRFNINVNCVAYGFVETRITSEKETNAPIKIEGKEIAVGVPKATISAMKMMVPLGRTCTPEEAAGPVLFLASPLSDYMTGEVLCCSGGVRV